MQWLANISARKAGAIGTLGAERRAYLLAADSRDDATMTAIRRGHADGLEHVMVQSLAEDPLSYLPDCRNRVFPWFDQYGATLDDAQSFRHMIRFAVEDRNKAAALESDWRKAGMWREIKAEIAAADVLIAAMRARLSAILGVPADV